MARPLRVQFSGAPYHITAPGNERKPIFRDERDRPAQVRKYLSQYLSADAQTRSVWRSRSSHPAAISNCRPRLSGDGGPLQFGRTGRGHFGRAGRSHLYRTIDGQLPVCDTRPGGAAQHGSASRKGVVP